MRVTFGAALRWFYSLLFYCALPGILLRLLWRSLKAPAYRLRWSERLGFYTLPKLTNVIWLHAVSVGEAETAFLVLRRLQLNYPDAQFLVTTTTPTGSARVQTVLGKQVHHVYLPYDTPDVVQRFLAQFQPKLALILETEIWPNLFIACRQQQIPLFIVNARLSARSARNYHKILALVQHTLSAVTTIAAQTDADAQRFLSLGARVSQVQLCGNLKFDLPPLDNLIQAGQQLRSELFPKRFVWLLASSHEGEETIFLKLLPQLKRIAPELLLVIAPRHPERFAKVNQLCLQQQLTVVQRTSNKVCTPETDVYLADTLGELKLLYATADIAFVAGSLVNVGGHNVLEAAAVGVPVLFGPFMYNFAAIADGLLAANAALQCQDENAVVANFEHLYQHPEECRILATNALHFLERNQGATDNILTLLRPILA